MMMVETVLRQSQIHGVGVFLAQRVEAGQLIWRFDSRIDRVYAPEEIESLPAHVQRYLRTYSTWHAQAGLFVLCGDNAKWMNHSDEANTAAVFEGAWPRSRALRPGPLQGSEIAA